MFQQYIFVNKYINISPGLYVHKFIGFSGKGGARDHFSHQYHTGYWEDLEVTPEVKVK